MKLSTKGRYGLRAMLVLANHYGEKPVLLRKIAENQEISVRYLENIMTVMVSGGLVNSMRGKNGGFTLARPAGEIKASEIIQLLEGSLAPVACVDDPSSCTRADGCVTHQIWEKIKKAILGVLEDITLADMLQLQKTSENAKEKGSQMYYI